MLFEHITIVTIITGIDITVIDIITGTIERNFLVGWVPKKGARSCLRKKLA
jgi:hypothetical protein